MNKSCNDSLALFVSETEIQFCKKSHLAFLDIKGAYDNVDPSTLINEFIEINLPKNLILFIYNLISVRHIKFINYPSNIVRSTFKGLPKGILSSILFSIYINKLDDLISPKVQILKFADDIALFATNPQLKLNLKSLEQQIKIFICSLG